MALTGWMGRRHMNTIYGKRTSKLDGKMLPFIVKATKFLENKTRELVTFSSALGHCIFPIVHIK